MILETLFPFITFTTVTLLLCLAAVIPCGLFFIMATYHLAVCKTGLAYLPSFILPALGSIACAILAHMHILADIDIHPAPWTIPDFLILSIFPGLDILILSIFAGLILYGLAALYSLIRYKQVYPPYQED